MDWEAVVRVASELVDGAGKDLEDARALRTAQGDATRGRVLNAAEIDQRQRARRVLVRRLIELRAQKDLLTSAPVTVPGRDRGVRNLEQRILAIKEELNSS
jgi:hypothetical protein